MLNILLVSDLRNYNEAVDKNNKANNLKDLQDAADYFLKNSYNVGVDYDNH